MKEAKEQSGKSSPGKQKFMQTSQGKKKGGRENVAMGAKKTIVKATSDATLDSESGNKESNEGNN